MIQLYRGFRDPLVVGCHKNPFFPNLRVPRHTNAKAHATSDQWFFKNFGVFARSGSLMCSTDIMQARKYSPHVYLVEPDETAILIYSSKVRDFIDFVFDGVSSKHEAELFDWLEAQEFQAVHTSQMIEPDFLGEVMVFCEHFKISQLPGPLLRN